MCYCNTLHNFGMEIYANNLSLQELSNLHRYFEKLLFEILKEQQRSWIGDRVGLLERRQEP